MALRTIRIQGDPVLTKVCRPIPEVTDRIRTLAEDMLETMYEANGVGLAAPQVGILKRMVVIDIGDGQGPFIMINPEIIESEANGVGLAGPQVGVLKRIVVIDIGEGPVVMINPVILEKSGEQTGDEGCLSLPGKAGQVTRPNHVKAKFYDLDMNEWEVEGEGLMARCICHELDHLDGHMYTEKVEGGLHDVNYEEPEEE